MNIGTIMSETTSIEIANDTLSELMEIGHDYNAVIRDLIHEHNCNRLIEEGDRLIRDHRDEFVSIDDL